LVVLATLPVELLIQFITGLVLIKIRIVIQNAKARGCHIGICGEAPSNHPDFARFLVSEGISSISVNAQSVLSTIVSVAESEAGR
jgi:pyruvate,water dikinase